MGFVQDVNRENGTINTDKVILIGLIFIALSLSGPAFAKSLICKSKFISKSDAAHKFTIFLPDDLEDTIAHINLYGEIEKNIGPKVGIGIMEREDPGMDARYEFYQYKRNASNYLLGFAVSPLGGNILTIMIEVTKAGKVFKLHTKYTLFSTVEWACE